MNYIQIEIGGQLRGLKFNNLALEVYHKNLNYDYAIHVSAIYSCFFAGLIGNCYQKSVEPDFTFEDVVNWVDDLFDAKKKDVITQVCKVWEETTVYKEWLKDYQDKIKSILAAAPDNKSKKKAK